MRRAASILVAAALAASPTSALAQGDAPKKEVPKLTKAPKLTRFEEAPFPESEKAAGKAATVVVRISINAEGGVDDVAVVESGGAAFDTAALQAVKKFKFEPAEIDGKPAGVRILYKYEFTLREEKPTKGTLVGKIVSRGKGDPVAGVEVELDGAKKVVTDASGSFVFDDVPEGKHAIRITGKGVKEISTEETVEAGKKITVKYDLDVKDPSAQPSADDDEIEVVVTAPPLRRQVLSTEVSADQGRRVPGTQGDVLKVVESMPGVARAAVGSGALVVWGAAPQDTRVYVDGVRVPTLYHNGGFRSVVHSSLVRSVELSPGGYGSPYGRGLGGLVTVGLRPLDDDKLNGSVAVDLLDASASVRGPLGKGLQVAAAVRRSHLDQALSAFTKRDVGDLVPIPKYADGQLRVAYVPSKQTSVELGVLGSQDRIERTLVARDPADDKRETREQSFSRLYLRYRATTTDGAVVDVVPWVGKERSKLVARFGGTPTELDVAATTYALRATYRARAASFLTVTGGLDAEVQATTLRRAGSITSPAREGDVRVFGQAPSDQVNVDDWSTTIGTFAPFVEGDFALFGDRLHVVPGLRFEPYVVSGSRRTPAAGDTPAVGYVREDTAVEPRVAARLAATDRLSVKAAYGVYHQAPQPEDLSAVFGNPTLGLAKATHLLVGGAARVTDTISVEASVFQSRSEGLAVRSTSSAPLLAQALTDVGEGRAKGLQVLLRKELSGGFFGWVSYSLLRSERIDAPGRAARLFDYDQTHVVTALGSYDLGKGFEIGARGRYATGYPRTPVVGAYYDAKRDGWVPLFGAQNSIRIPAFVQLDLRVAKRFKAAGGEGEAYLDVQNVTNRKNPEELVYSYDYKTRGTITGLPILPVVGVQWSF